jgi:hypothetical protein
VNRELLLAEYNRLCGNLVKAGAEPVVSSSVLDAFSDQELAELVKDSALWLSRLRGLSR